MEYLFETTGEDIGQLNDADLRDLIGLLSEEECKSRGISTKGILWGGHQDAPDGGVDVLVMVDTPIGGYIPRQSIVFQVKKHKMPPSKIRSEMTKNHQLKPEILNLSKSNGAYIIVSSGDDCSPSALKERINKMTDVSGSIKDIYFDFYDRNRVASWVRHFPHIMLWVKSKLGVSISGWQNFASWSGNPVDDEYILDDKLKIFDSNDSKGEELLPLQAIQRIRDRLSQRQNSVRLIGLSGVGKTRFAQSLFEDNVGEKPLDKAKVFYTDVGHSPNPIPSRLIEELIKLNGQGVLIVDNCSNKLHSQLSKLVKDKDSKLSLLTIEYDISEDIPESTNVFKMESSSDDLISQLVLNRFSSISKVNARTIADFSGGNARVALALAERVQVGESLSSLKNKDLLERLFQQRNDPNENLLKAAQILSLVYSFDITVNTGSDCELGVLSSLIEFSTKKLYGYFSEIEKRGLAQSRSHWRAILPHALANPLAEQALESIPTVFITEELSKNGNERLLMSFAHRLGYLHENKHAQEIVRNWLSKDGILGRLEELNETKTKMFEWIAPVNIESTLIALERVAQLLPEESKGFFNPDKGIKFLRVCRALAYEDKYFYRAVKILLRYADEENVLSRTKTIRNELLGLFQLYLSGTHARPETRVSLLKEMIYQDNSKETETALSLLNHAFTTLHFSSISFHDFGARSRDYGYHPNNLSEVQGWYRAFLDFALELQQEKTELRDRVKNILAQHFRGMWSSVGIYTELEEMVYKLTQVDDWGDCLVSVNRTITYDHDEMPEDALDRLKKLSLHLSPKGLVEMVHTFVINQHYHGGDFTFSLDKEDDRIDQDEEIANRQAIILGKRVAIEPEALEKLLPDLIQRGGSHRLWHFGKGLALETKTPFIVWSKLTEAFKAKKAEDRQNSILSGFIEEYYKADPDEVISWIIEGYLDENLKATIVYFETRLPVSPNGYRRLLDSIKDDSIPANSYFGLLHYEDIGRLPSYEYMEILRKLSLKEEGVYWAIEILSLRFHSKKEMIPKYIKEVGVELLQKVDFITKPKAVRMDDHHLSSLVLHCIEDTDVHSGLVYRLCLKMNNLYRNGELFSSDYDAFIKSLATKQPEAFLNGFLLDEQGEVIKNSLFSLSFDRRNNPLSDVPDKVILDWCTINFQERTETILYLVQTYTQTSDQNKKLQWTSLTLSILEKVENLDPIFNILADSVRPRSWSGSLSSILTERVILFEQLENFKRIEVADWAKQYLPKFKEYISIEAENDVRRFRTDSETFE